MILTEKMAEALEILDTGTAAQAKITSTDYRTIQHATMARLVLHHLAEETGEEDFFHRPLFRITADGKTVLEARRALVSTATAPDPERTTR